jgi:hypothetical protein
VGIVSYTATLTGLATGTKYYVRAYATNSAGTVYGAEKIFTSDIQIGCDFQGGKVVYIFNPGDLLYVANETHGVIAAYSATMTNTDWGTSTPVMMNGTAVGEGGPNTTQLSNATPPSPAAQACMNLVYGGYSDWFLPSQDEMIYARNALGFLTNIYYWTSSESTTDNTKAITVHGVFNNGAQSNVKSDILKMLPCRYF